VPIGQLGGVERRYLVVIDGSKALRSGVERVFGDSIARPFGGFRCSHLKGSQGHNRREKLGETGDSP
jgi:hypothetical protein